MIVKLTDLRGHTLAVQTENVLFVSQSCDQKGLPLLGQTTIVFVGGIPGIVKGTPDEIYGALRRGEPSVHLEKAVG